MIKARMHEAFMPSYGVQNRFLDLMHEDSMSLLHVGLSSPSQYHV